MKDSVSQQIATKRGAVSHHMHLRGRRAYLSGQAAEVAVAKHYADRQCALLAKRWRGQAGEIDLIFKENGTYVFVEVKKADTFEAAADRLGVPQARRIRVAASEFLAETPLGQMSDMRFDLALCNAYGEVEIHEGAFNHF